MAFDPIAHWGINPGSYATRSAAVPSLDSQGYDTGRMQILYRGTYQQLLQTFAPGLRNMPGAPGTSRMYCQGIVGAPEAKFGGIWADISWIGYYSRPVIQGLFLIPEGTSGSVEGVRGYTQTLTAEDIDLPQTVGSTEVTLGPPFLPAGVGGNNPDTGAPWRARITDDIWVRTYTGTTISTPGAPPGAPRCVAPDPDPSDPINWTNSGNPGARALRRINYWPGKTTSGAWVRRDFQCSLDHLLGSVALYTWTCTFEWRQEYSI